MDTLGNTWLTKKARKVLIMLFDEISSNIAKTITKFEDSNNLASEDYLTEKIVDLIINLKNSDKYISIKETILKETSAEFSIDAYSNTNRKNEHISGIDIGLVMDINLDNFRQRKAILVQSKKAKLRRGNVSYPELKRRGYEQAEKMLSISPASFFFLYNPSKIIDIDHYSSQISDFIYKTNRRIFNDKEYYDLNNKQNDIINTESDKYLGILVCSAEVIKGNKNVNHNFDAMLPICRSFSDFVVDEFLFCIVGDTRESVLLNAGINRNNEDKIITNASLKLSVNKKDNIYKECKKGIYNPRSYRKITLPNLP